jgi:metallo-beta-lactamase class B
MTAVSLDVKEAHRVLGKREVLMRVSALIGVVLVAAGVLSAQQGPAQFSAEWYQQFRGPYSAPVEPFKIVGNIHYVGGANISSYLITTPQGHILIDTGMKEMHEVIKNSVAKLGFKTADIKIMLSSHAHFDHIEGHAMMQKLTGAQVMAMVGDAEALAAGKDNSALGAIGWEPVKVARVLKHGDTVSLGGTTLRALHTPGHTQGATTWITTVQDGGRQYTVGFLGGTTPNGGVPLFDNPRHKSVIEDTQRTFKTLKAEKVPDIYLVGHAQAMFAGKIDRIKAGATPHPLLNGEAWTKQIVEGEANFAKRVAEERAKLKK